MAEIFTVLEVADERGFPTGRFHWVSFSDESSTPVYHRLTDLEYASDTEARACPVAKEKLDRIFCRGPFAPVREPSQAEIEAGARWLMDDDTGYADHPDIAQRAAREILRAAARAKAQQGDAA